jgi:hypothetical protein
MAKTRTKRTQKPSNERVVFAVRRSDTDEVTLYSSKPTIEIIQTVSRASKDGGKTWTDTDKEETSVDVDGKGYIDTFCSDADEVLPASVQNNKVYKLTIKAEEV